jgi:hypothetical protein
MVKSSRKLIFLTRKLNFSTGKSVFLARTLIFLTRKQLFHVHNLSTCSNFFTEFFQTRNRDSPFPFEDVPSPVFIWGSPCGNVDSFFFNPRMETGIPHFHMGMCQSPFPYGDPRMEMSSPAKIFGDAIVPGAWLNGRPKLQSPCPYGESPYGNAQAD